MLDLFSELKSYRVNLHGVAATEFALIAPILMLMVIGIVDYGFYINHAMKVENTARAAAQYVVQGGDIDSISDDVMATSGIPIDEEQEGEEPVLAASMICTCADGEEVECDIGDICGVEDYPRNYITVTINKRYETFMPYPGLPDSLPIKRTIRLQVR